MHGRTTVTEWDWDKSEQVMALSDQTRTALLQQEAQVKTDALRERGKNDAIRYEGRDDYQLHSVKNSIVAVLTKRGGSASASALNSALGKPHRRKLLAQALAELADEGRVVAISVAGGTRYRLTGDAQGEQPVQGMLPQVSGPEQPVQDERRVNVVSLETHRSQKAGGRKISCQKWFDAYIEVLRAQGHDTVEAFAVRAAGEAAGYQRGNVDVAIHKRGFKGTVWSLAG
jgi:hypothetical protein